jgi:hypothetical protein
MLAWSMVLLTQTATTSRCLEKFTRMTLIVVPSALAVGNDVIEAI